MSEQDQPEDVHRIRHRNRIPGGPATEPVENTLAVIEAQAALWRPCRHCEAVMEALEPSEGGALARAVGINHYPGCPEYVDEESIEAVEYQIDDFLID